jgi:uncharacterized protein YdeI (YjbR/CyaY-like superfamily)
MAGLQDCMIDEDRNGRDCTVRAMAKTPISKHTRAKPKPRPIFFKDREAFRAWLSKNHDTAKEIYLGFYKASARRGGLTYLQAVEESLCFGWIDGRLNRIDEVSHMQRYTPRIAGSHWSRINIARARELQRAGRMTAAGLAAFEQRDEGKTINYSYELRAAEFPPALLKRFKGNRAAWTFFEAQAPSYRRLMTFWVASAKKPETQAKRFAQLLQVSAAGRRVNLLKSKDS